MKKKHLCRAHRSTLSSREAPGAREVSPTRTFSMPETLLFLTELLGLPVYDLKGRRIASATAPWCPGRPLPRGSYLIGRIGLAHRPPRSDQPSRQTASVSATKSPLPITTTMACCAFARPAGPADHRRQRRQVVRVNDVSSASAAKTSMTCRVVDVEAAHAALPPPVPGRATPALDPQAPEPDSATRSPSQATSSSLTRSAVCA